MWYHGCSDTRRKATGNAIERLEQPDPGTADILSNQSMVAQACASSIQVVSEAGELW